MDGCPPPTPLDEENVRCIVPVVSCKLGGWWRPGTRPRTSETGSTWTRPPVAYPHKQASGSNINMLDIHYSRDIYFEENKNKKLNINLQI